MQNNIKNNLYFHLACDHSVIGKQTLWNVKGNTFNSYNRLYFFPSILILFTLYWLWNIDCNNLFCFFWKLQIKFFCNLYISYEKFLLSMDLFEFMNLFKKLFPTVMGFWMEAFMKIYFLLVKMEHIRLFFIKIVKYEILM